MFCSNIFNLVYGFFVASVNNFCCIDGFYEAKIKNFRKARVRRGVSLLKIKVKTAK